MRRRCGKLAITPEEKHNRNEGIHTHTVSKIKARQEKENKSKLSDLKRPDKNWLL